MRPNITKLIKYFFGGAVAVSFTVSFVLPSLLSSTVINISQNTTTRNDPLIAPTSSYSLETLLGKSLLGDRAKNNLTQNFAKNLAEAIVSANTSGPTSTKTAQAIILPGNDAVKNALAESVASLDPKNMGLTISITDQDVVMKNDASLNTIHNYFASANDIIGKTLGSTNFVNLARGAQDTPTITLENQIVLQAVSELKGLPVPQKLAAYHKRLILALTHLGEISNAMQDTSSDPLKTTALIKGGKTILGFDTKAMQDEYQKINWNGLAISLKSQSLSDVLETFFAPHAYADEVPVHDQDAIDLLQEISDTDKQISTTLDDTYQLLFDEWNSIIKTQQKKYEVVQGLQQDVLNWVLNDKNPRFIQNWQDYIAGASIYQAAITIQDLASANALDPEIQNDVLSFVAQTNLRANAIPKATLDDTIGANGGQGPCPPDWQGPCPAQQSFQNNFWQGGFPAWAELLKPQNNFAGASMIYSDAVAEPAGLAAQAAISEGIANNGFLSEKVCVESTAANNCRKWAITMPGVKVKDALDDALRAAIDEIVNMQYLPDCLDSIWSESLLSNIMNQGTPENGLLGDTGSGFTLPTDCKYPPYPDPRTSE